MQVLSSVDGEMADRIRAFDWQGSIIGPIETWPVELQTTLALCLNTDLPTAIYWGTDFRLLYNDAWAPIAGEKHPWALGRPASEVWSDIWHVIDPQLLAVIESGKGFRVANQMLPMERGGRIQNTHWDYSFAPIFAADGRVAGIFNQGTETTARLSAERALRASEERLEYALGASVQTPASPRSMGWSKDLRQAALRLQSSSSWSIRTILFS
jgi:PAS domain-containing protein